MDSLRGYATALSATLPRAIRTSSTAPSPRLRHHPQRAAVDELGGHRDARRSGPVSSPTRVWSPRSGCCSTAAAAATTLPTPSTAFGLSWTAAPAPTSPNACDWPGPSTPGKPKLLAAFTMTGRCPVARRATTDRGGEHAHHKIKRIGRLPRPQRLPPSVTARRRSGLAPAAPIRGGSPSWRRAPWGAACVARTRSGPGAGAVDQAECECISVRLKTRSYQR